ncbi:hypothetical protein [Pseudomonas syringae group genomosp. 3]|uniref:Uncharacterized protein n=1 Tax=Pseudomonas syringae pv. viburni TaxID=251703 RepID=A0A0Q0EEY5_9PSED|nr:hypothetical protein [Pseudomonas syringae group genomosp. 3]KPZ09688.1 Unknown protein sequence [Pseudomonas syringae pv. viburni]
MTSPSDSLTPAAKIEPVTKLTTAWLHISDTSSNTPAVDFYCHIKGDEATTTHQETIVQLTPGTHLFTHPIFRSNYSRSRKARHKKDLMSATSLPERQVRYIDT